MWKYSIRLNVKQMKKKNSELTVGCRSEKWPVCRHCSKIVPKNQNLGKTNRFKSITVSRFDWKCIASLSTGQAKFNCLPFSTFWHQEPFEYKQWTRRKPARTLPHACAWRCSGWWMNPTLTDDIICFYYKQLSRRRQNYHSFWFGQYFCCFWFFNLRYVRNFCVFEVSISWKR